MEQTSAIEIRGLGKRFGRKNAVDDVTFDVRLGEIFGFVGHNGAGKTTTLRMLIGLLKPTSGEARVLGHDIVRDTLTIRRLSGFLPGEFSLPKEMTARQFLRYIGAMFGLAGSELEQRIDGLLDSFQLINMADRRLTEFSAGMSQKIGLAQALLNEPQVLLLDEPTSGLDPIGRHQLLERIRGLAAEGAAILFSTHILTDVEQVCERVAILHEGRVIANDDLAKLKEKHGFERMDDLYLALARDQA